MKKIWLLTIVGMLALCNATQAEEAPKFVSATFQDILSRVVERDKTSGAILGVKPKEDSSLRIGILYFSIVQERMDLDWKKDEVVISLTMNNKVDDGIHERYRLKIDDAMREELKKQQHYQEMTKERAKKWQEGEAKKIEQLTDGKLKYGMPQAEVEAIKGKPLKIEMVPTAAVFLFNPPAFWFYPNIRLYFLGGILQSAENVE